MIVYEIWNRDGVQVADLTGLARERKFTAGRNKAGEISFRIDTKQLVALAETHGTTAAGLLGVGSNELRIRKDDTYLRLGGRIDYVNHHGSGADMETTVTAPGFLDMLSERFLEVQRIFAATQATTILWTVLNEMQTGSGNFWAAPTPSAARSTLGITQGTLATIATKDRTYEAGKSVKDILVQMTELQSTDTDIEITQTKVFNAYERMGSDKPQLAFELGQNIIDYDIPVDAKSLVNRAITFGAGVGEDSRVQSIDEDATSQTAYKVRQYIRQFNSIEDEAELSDYGAAFVAAAKDPLVIPEIRVDLNQDIGIHDFWVGDAVTVRIIDPDLPTTVDGLFRIEEINYSVADSGYEMATLSLSSWE